MADSAAFPRVGLDRDRRGLTDLGRSLWRAADNSLPRPLPMALALAVYAASLIVMLPRHEPWLDEAQAWLLARDTSPVSLFAKYIEYEGSPGLWQLILMLPAHLALPYRTLSVIGGLLGVVGAYLLARFAPFPWWLRMGLMFSYFLLYQYGVIARSYNLLPPILFALAALWTARREHPILLHVLLALLANVSAHALLMAVGIYVTHLVADRGLALRQWRSRAVIVGSVIFAAALAAALLQLRIPADESFGWWQPNYNPLHFLRTSANIYRLALTGISPLSIAVLALSLPVLWRGRALLVFLLPTLGVLAIACIKYYAPWHTGILFLIWIFALWIAMRGAEARPRKLPEWHRIPPLLNRAPVALAMAALAVVTLIQLRWTWVSYSSDFTQPYSGSEAVANYIRENHLEYSHIDARNWLSFAVQPYFDHDLFWNNWDNGPHARQSFYMWTKAELKRDRIVYFEADKPDYIVWSEWLSWSEPVPKIPGYRVIARFQGYQFFEDWVNQPDTFFLLERIEPQPGPAAGRLVPSPRRSGAWPRRLVD